MTKSRPTSALPISPGLLLMGFLLCAIMSGQAKENTVTVTPALADEILTNPGMGWETFARPARMDTNLPSWIPSTVEYAQYSWHQLETQQGELNTEFLDHELSKAHDSGQKLALRIKCYSPSGPKHPMWLEAIGGKIRMADYGAPDHKIPIVDLDDPVVLKSHLDFIRMLGEHYDGNPDLDHVDIGSVGWWGEWHLSRCTLVSMPTLETRMKVVDAYLSAFKKTPLLMLGAGGECTAYAIRHGAGWRVDSFGDLGSSSRRYNHSIDDYPVSFVRNGVLDVWKTAPVAFEPRDSLIDLILQAPVEREVPGTHQKLSIAHPLRWIFNYGLALHGTYFNGKSARFPEDPEFKSEMERFLKRLGYRLELSELSYHAEVKAGEKLELSMKWRNSGSAPCYSPYRLAYRIADAQGHKKVFVGPVTVNNWMPGSIDVFTPEFFNEVKDLPPGESYKVADSIVLPKEMPPGEYTLSVGVVGVDSEQPVVRLGISGRDSEGWYPLGKIKVTQ